MRIGLFGGTFDPPHVGHLIVARDVLEARALDQIRFVPAARSPHKRVGAVSSGEARWAMLEAAVSGDEAFGLSRAELDREAPSYTVDTVRALTGSGRDHEWHVIMGADQFARFHEWKEPEEIARLAQVTVMTRAGFQDSDPRPEIEVAHRVVPVTRIELSSSEIRERVNKGRSIRYLVPDPVRGIIEERALYRGTANPPTHEIRGS